MVSPLSVVSSSSEVAESLRIMSSGNCVRGGDDLVDCKSSMAAIVVEDIEADEDEDAEEEEVVPAASDDDELADAWRKRCFRGFLALALLLLPSNNGAAVVSGE